jgi:hypothetical protein
MIHKLMVFITRSIIHSFIVYLFSKFIIDFFLFEKFIIEFNVNLSTLLYGDDNKFIKNRKQTFIFYNLFESIPPFPLICCLLMCLLYLLRKIKIILEIS